MMGPSAYRLCSVLLLTMTLLTLVYGQAFPNSACKLTIPNNRTVLKQLSKFFEKDSSIAIIEYSVKFRNHSDERDFMKQTRNDSYQPLRWYRTQGQESSRLLLTYTNFLGIIRLILSFGIQSVDLAVDVNPPGCLHDLANVTVEDLIREFLLIDLENSVNHEASSSKDVNICTARFSKIYKTNDLVFSCCILESDKEKLIDCNYVENNAWSRGLTFIIVLAIIFYPTFSVIQSTKESSDCYIYTVPDNRNLTFNILRTNNARRHQNMDKPKLQHSSFQKITKFNNSLEYDTVYKMSIKRVTFDVPTSRLLMEGQATIIGWRIVYDYFTAKVHRGEYDEVEGHEDFIDNRCCTMKTTVIIYALILLALPSLPILYTVFDGSLWFWELAKTMNEIPQMQTYPSLTSLTVYLAIIYSFYLVLPLIIIICGCGLAIEEFYRTLIKKEMVHAKWVNRPRKCLSYICYKMINWCRSRCICCLPFVLIVCAILYILSTIISFILRAIAGKFIIALLDSFVTYMSNEKRKCGSVLFFVFIIMIILHAFSLLHVLFLGIMCLSIIFISVIIFIVVEINIFHNTFPILMVELFYILTSYQEIIKRFDKFIVTLLDDKHLKMSDVLGKGSNNMFAFGTQYDSSIKVRESKLCLKLKTPFLFVSEDDIKHISRAFAYRCSNIKCEGAPGALSEIFINETKRLIQFGFFLLFVFLIIKSYGSFVFISPYKYIIITFIMGLVPMLWEKLSKRHSDAKLGKRFRKNLKKEIAEFWEEWIVDKMEVEVSVSDLADENIDLIIVPDEGPSCCQIL